MRQRQFVEEQGTENLYLKSQDGPELRLPFFLLPPRQTGSSNLVKHIAETIKTFLSIPKTWKTHHSIKDENKRGSKWAFFISNMSYYTQSWISWWYKTYFTDTSRSNFQTADLDQKEISSWDKRLHPSSKPFRKPHLVSSKGQVNKS